MKKQTSSFIAVLLIFYFFSNLTSYCYAAENNSSMDRLLGVWRGNIKYYGIESPLIFDITANKSGDLKVKLESPYEGENITYKASKAEQKSDLLIIKFKDINSSFTGDIQPDKTIKGIFTGQSFKSEITLKHLKEIPEFKVPEYKKSYEICPEVGDKSITDILNPIRQKYKIPALSAAVVNCNGIASVGAVGVRKNGTDISVGLNDLWMLGSDTKAMTATLAARFVEEGKLKWNTTIGEVFPKFASEFNSEFRNITIKELLSHHSGLPGNVDFYKYKNETITQQRLNILVDASKSKLLSIPGTEYLYSNLGYTIIGAILEKISGKSWETLMREMIFKPLDMKSAGFGGTGTPGKIDQPWPHLAVGLPTEMNGPDVDIPAVMGPAGNVHCTIQDWAKFITDQLNGACGKNGLLKAATYKILQTPAFGGNYALGWGTAEIPELGKVLSHAGSNTFNMANVLIIPKYKIGILVCCNQGGLQLGKNQGLTATENVIAGLLNSDKFVKQSKNQIEKK